MKLTPKQIAEVFTIFNQIYGMNDRVSPQFDILGKQVFENCAADAKEYTSLSMKEKNIADEIQVDVPLRQIRIKDLPELIPGAAIDYLAPVLADYGTIDIRPREKSNLKELIKKAQKKEEPTEEPGKDE